MAILKVARLGHPVLRQKSLPVPVAEIALPETQRLIDDLVETEVVGDLALKGFARPVATVALLRLRGT